jgi:hypothetical protein
MAVNETMSRGDMVRALSQYNTGGTSAGMRQLEPRSLDEAPTLRSFDALPCYEWGEIVTGRALQPGTATMDEA